MALRLVPGIARGAAVPAVLWVAGAVALYLAIPDEVRWDGTAGIVPYFLLCFLAGHLGARMTVRDTIAGEAEYVASLPVSRGAQALVRLATGAVIVVGGAAALGVVSTIVWKSWAQQASFASGAAYALAVYAATALICSASARADWMAQGGFLAVLATQGLVSTLDDVRDAIDLRTLLVGQAAILGLGAWIALRSKEAVPPAEVDPRSAWSRPLTRGLAWLFALIPLALYVRGGVEVLREYGVTAAAVGVLGAVALFGIAWLFLRRLGPVAIATAVILAAAMPPTVLGWIRPLRKVQLTGSSADTGFRINGGPERAGVIELPAIRWADAGPIEWTGHESELIEDGDPRLRREGNVLLLDTAVGPIRLEVFHRGAPAVIERVMFMASYEPFRRQDMVHVVTTSLAAKEAATRALEAVVARAGAFGPDDMKAFAEHGEAAVVALNRAAYDDPRLQPFHDAAIVAAYGLAAATTKDARTERARYLWRRLCSRSWRWARPVLATPEDGWDVARGIGLLGPDAARWLVWPGGAGPYQTMILGEIRSEEAVKVLVNRAEGERAHGSVRAVTLRALERAGTPETRALLEKLSASERERRP